MIHPILISVYPTISLWAQNLGDVPFSSIVRSIIFSLILCGLLLMFFRWTTKDWLKSGVITSITLLLFASYQAIRVNIAPATNPDQAIAWTLGLLVALLIGSTWIVITRKHELIKPIAGFLSAIAIVALLLPTIRIFMYLGQSLPEEPWQSNCDKNARLIPKSTTSAQDVPDIYYIILDGYGGADILAEQYGIDNSHLLQFLSEAGFYVAEESKSNYSVTLVSLASSLNMEYVNYVSDLPVRGARVGDTFSQMLKESCVRRILQDIGYTSVAFQTGYLRTEVTDADVFLQLEEPDRLREHLGPFEVLLLNTTMLSPLLNEWNVPGSFVQETITGPAHDLHRKRIEFSLEMLGQIPSLDGSYFVLAHLLAPHPPFVFAENGDPTESNHPLSFDDGSYFEGSPQDYVEGYGGQLAYLNSRLEPIIRKILDDSDPQPIIILQGDHGPGAFVDWEQPNNTDYRERFSILNAYYLPGIGSSMLYPTISPVNSFRVLLNEAFESEFQLLDDTSYFSSITDIRNFVNVTHQLGPQIPGDG